MKERPNRKHLKKKFCVTLFALAVVSLLSTTTIYGGGKNKMEYLYDCKDAITLTPQVYKMNASSSLSLFPVPFDNAVGTNDITNAVTIISFPNGKLDQENYFRKALDDIQGGGTYLPVISQDLIGFGQTRVFYLFNFKTKTAEEYRIVYSIDATIEQIAIADAQRRRFIFEIQEHKRGSVDVWDFTNSLHLIDLYGKQLNLLKKMLKGVGSIWATAYDRVFLWYFTEKEVEVFDMNLESSNHPLADALKRNKNKVDFSRLAPHPTLPFAILYGGDYGSTYISWGEGRDKTPKLLLSGVDQVSFSPDGKWISFRKYIHSRQENTYLMPVSEKYPNYLGSPILLMKNYFNAKNCAWTTNPTSFVGSDSRLHRWELTKVAQRSIMGEDADKYPTFHDYIVAKDLVKLTKEKKQGLGK